MGLALFYGRDRRKYLTGLSTGFAAFTVPMLSYMHFDLAGMWHDLLEMALARRGETSRIWAIAGSYFDWIGVMLLVGLLYATRLGANGRLGWLRRREAVYAVFVVLAEVLVLFTNHQLHGMPLNSVLVMLISGNISMSGLGSPQLDASTLLRGAFVLLALSLVLPTAIPDLIGVGFSVYRQAFTYHQLAPSQTFHTPRLGGMWVVGSYPRGETEEYVRDIEDGLGMIERLSPPNESVYSTDFSSPFSYALGRPPAHGGAWSLHYHMGIDDRHHPDPDFAFGGADILMEPKYPTCDMEGIMRIYREFINSHFHLFAESSRWRMYRQNRQKLGERASEVGPTGTDRAVPVIRKHEP